jgi:nucleoside-specific outer membrane channel protein Tsx
MKKTLLALAGASLLSVSAQAEQFWADNSISLLYGSDYEFHEDEDLTTMTLEHVSGHSWGGLFGFVDRHSGAGYTETYGELSPAFTLTKMDGMVSAVNLVYTYEFGQSAFGGMDNHLVGAGVDLKAPGMDFLSVNLYRAFNDKTGGDDNDDNQITVSYGYSNGNFIIDGFMDYSFGSDRDSTEDSMNFTPQITYNVGPMLGTKSKVKVGVEYSYWTSQFGIDGQDQSAISLLLKAHL